MIQQQSIKISYYITFGTNKTSASPKTYGNAHSKLLREKINICFHLLELKDKSFSSIYFPEVLPLTSHADHDATHSTIFNCIYVCRFGHFSEYNMSILKM